MKDLAIAYGMRRRSNPMKMAHGGEAMSEVECMHCGGMYNPKLREAHMAKGGMVSNEMDMSGDMDEASDRFDMENSPEDSEVHNEMSDSLMDMDEDEAKKEVKPSGMLLSRILGGLRRAHSGKA